MPYTPETLFFDIKRRHGLLFVELRTRDTGRLLKPAEALQVAEIPEGFVIEPNPENPGKAAFISRVHKGPMMTKVMQDAGFRYDAEDAEKFDARVIEHAKLDAEKAVQEMMRKLIKAFQSGEEGAREKLLAEVEAQNPGKKVASITQNESGMVVIGMAESELPETPPVPVRKLADFKAVRFHIGARNERANDGSRKDTVRVAIETFNPIEIENAGSSVPEGHWEHSDGEKFGDLPDFLHADGSHLYASDLPVEETRKRLLEMGWAEEPRIFLWYRPDQLAFGVIADGDGDGPQIFLMPIEDNCDFDGELLPFEDDLRGQALEVHPEFMGDDTMENTFELAENLGVNEIKLRMLGLGFTYDPELDDGLN